MEQIHNCKKRMACCTSVFFLARVKRLPVGLISGAGEKKMKILPHHLKQRTSVKESS
jgi:hypothetical protein